MHIKLIAKYRSDLILTLNEKIKKENCGVCVSNNKQKLSFLLKR
jgi:hypothetical protein